MDFEVKEAQRGDRAAMVRIVDDHYDGVFAFCARRVGPDMASDVAQETFITAQKRLKTFEGRSSFKTWLLGIANNECRSALRSKRKDEVDWMDFEPSANPEHQLIDRQALKDAMKTLSKEHREAVLLHEVDGLTYEEAATILGVPEGTVKSRLHHAFLALRKSLQSPIEVNP